MRLRLAVLFVSFVFPAALLAEELFVRDCLGRVRWVEELDSGRGGVLEAFVEGASEVAEARLVRERDGAVLEGVLGTSGVSFTGVTAGDWKLCAAPKRSSFSRFRFTANPDTQQTSPRTAAITVGGVGSALGLMALGSGDSGGADANTGGASPQPLVGELPSDATDGGTFIDENVAPISPLS